jgi:hypothetical protein
MNLNVDFKELFEAVEAMGATPIDFDLKLGKKDEINIVTDNKKIQNSQTEDAIAKE